MKNKINRRFLMRYMLILLSIFSLFFVTGPIAQASQNKNVNGNTASIEFYKEETTQSSTILERADNFPKKILPQTGETTSDSLIYLGLVLIFLFILLRRMQRKEQKQERY